MNVSAQYAADHLADLLTAAQNGEDVKIEQPHLPALNLSLSVPLKTLNKDGRRVLGAGRGEMRVPSEEEWKAMDRELEILMNGSPSLLPGRNVRLLMAEHTLLDHLQAVNLYTKVADLILDIDKSLFYR